MDEHMTTDEAAERLKVTPQTVVRYIKDGKLSAVKFGKGYRIPAAEISRLLGLAQSGPQTGSAEVIAIANQQAEAGKTTTAINLAAAMGARGAGKRVLLVDLDPQGALSAALGIDTAGAETLYGVLFDTVAVNKALVRTEFGFDLIPANIELAGAEFELAHRLMGELTLRRKLEPLLERYDLVLLDCPSSLGLLTSSALAAASSVIVPVSADAVQQRGLEMLLGAIDAVKNAFNSQLRVAGLLVTQFKPATANGRETLALISDFAQATSTRLFGHVVKQSTLVGESLNYQKPFVLLYRGEDAAQAYTQIAQEIASGEMVPVPMLDVAHLSGDGQGNGYVWSSTAEHGQGAG